MQNDENGNARNLLAVRRVLAVPAVVSSSPIGLISASQKVPRGHSLLADVFGVRIVKVCYSLLYFEVHVSQSI